MKYQTKTRVVEAITFDELVEYGRSVTPQGHLMSGMPWSFKYKGHHVTHENDTCYLILGLETDLLMTPGDMLILGEHGEIWTCMHDTFEATYEPAETAPQSSDAANKPATGFEVAVRPLIRWMYTNVHPHHTAVVTAMGAELLEGKLSVRDPLWNDREDER